MSLRNDRNARRDTILEGKFITKILQEEGKEINKDIDSKMRRSSFNSTEWNDKKIIVSENTLTYTHLKRHRFIDMKTRASKKGTKRKKNYPIHNKIIFGRINNIIRDLAHGYTDEVIEQLKKVE